MSGWLSRVLAESRFEWPVELTEARLELRGLCRGVDVVRLRPLRTGDAAAWRALRVAEEGRLARWDATLPPGCGEGELSFAAYVRGLRRQARAGTAMPFAIEADGDFAGQVSVEPIVWGSMRSATLGYWLGSRWEGRGVMTLCVAMLLDYLLGPEVGLHRVEVNIRPENGPSLAVVRKLVLREEGMRLRYMHVAGRWADHRSFAATVEELGVGYVHRLEERAVPPVGGEHTPA
ncbi:GNAT family N-acetyltransferase [Actinomyces trachealis]|uniref:GNAT family N-acetyltransferase n=1 Tax=Actinomyces trachealis TaxID=2763540 RepID=UPI0018929934|nr:GNAT family protein [Actinomyces trachealis]